MRNNAIGLLLAALVPVAALALDTAPFPSRRDLKEPASSSRDIGSFVLDDVLYEATTGDFDNIRIIDGQEQEVRFLLRRRTKTETRTTQHELALKTLSFRKLEDNRIEIVLESGKDDPAPGSVELFTRQSNYEKQVTVYGSNDRLQWTVLADKQPIFDYSRYLDIRSNEIELQPLKYPFYKIDVANITETSASPWREIVRGPNTAAGDEIAERFTMHEETLRIDRIVFRARTQTTVDREPVICDYQALDMKVTESLEDKATVITFATARQPVTAVRLETQSRNFSRQVTVQAATGDREQTGWRTVGNGKVTSIRTSGIHRETLRIPLNQAVRSGTCKLIIRNEDNPPLSISGIALEGYVYDVFFLKAPGAGYRVLYGGRNIAAPRYDIAAVLDRISIADTDVYELSEPKANPGHTAKPRSATNSRVFMIATLIVMTLMLCWIIARAARNINNTDTGEAGPPQNL